MRRRNVRITLFDNNGENEFMVVFIDDCDHEVGFRRVKDIGEVNTKTAIHQWLIGLIAFTPSNKIVNVTIK